MEKRAGEGPQLTTIPVPPLVIQVDTSPLLVIPVLDTGHFRQCYKK
ncbi:hypothetical protein [Wolbachia endosymbiont (group B) of Limnophora tigrina]